MFLSDNLGLLTTKSVQEGSQKGTDQAGNAVVMLPDIVLEARPITYQSAQAAEMIELTRACILHEGTNSPFSSWRQSSSEKPKERKSSNYGPPTTVVAVTHTAVLTEETATWIQATRVKLLKEAPQKEVITGADSPDLENGQSEVLTGADSSDLHQDSLNSGKWHRWSILTMRPLMILLKTEIPSCSKDSSPWGWYTHIS